MLTSLENYTLQKNQEDKNFGHISNKIANAHRNHRYYPKQDYDIDKKSAKEIIFNKIYIVNKIGNAICCKNICRLCKLCYHMYTCTCYEYLIRGNICSHIHCACGLLSNSKEIYYKIQKE